MSSLASSSSHQPKLKSEYDVLLIFFKLEERASAFIKNSLRDAGFTFFIHDALKGELDWEMENSCSIKVVVITPVILCSDKSFERLRSRIGYDDKTVLPFFYGVSQNEAIVQLENYNSRRRSRIKRGNWQVSELADKADTVFYSPYGYTLSHDLSDKEIVQNVIARAISQVGLQPRVNEVLYLSGWKSHHPKKSTIIVGIWGIGGIGKTTIVRAIYDVMGGHFAARSFLANVKDVWEKNNGQVLLQRQLLSDIQVNNVEQGPYRRALIVLDDVNQVGQLIELCGNREQFGEGSLIFITTRNEGLLDHFVDKSYEVQKFGNIESLQLFRWHAFKNSGPTDDCDNLSRNIISLCNGLPLILEVIGSLLHNKTKSEWEQVLNKLENVSSDQIQNMLKISLDLLADSERKLFCDVARFHVGRSKNYVTSLFKGSAFPIEMRMQVLIERSFVKVDHDKIHVHDLLQEIGRQISTNKPKFTYTYDVFLSFRGEDTRKTFATHLYTSLKQAGIEVFMDEDGIARGEHISGSLLLAIECSRISIIIFSKNYAGSSWCLQELEKIMECYKTTDQKVFPIFYDVQPSEVRKQQNTFGKAWEQLFKRPSSSEGKKLTNNFKRVLVEAANLSGWDMQNYREQKLSRDCL